MASKTVFLLTLCVLCAYATPQKHLHSNDVLETSEDLQFKQLAELLNADNFNPKEWSEKLSFSNFNPAEWLEKLNQLSSNLKGLEFDSPKWEKKLKQINFNPEEWAKKLKQVDIDLDEWNNAAIDHTKWPVGYESKQVHPDQGLNVVELIEQHGYPVETHHVTTNDNYILGLHRIPHGRNSSSTNETKPVVLVMAGILCSSADWVLNGPGNALAYLLADAGYDVWLGNNRGTTSSRNHSSISPSRKKFWDFSWHEMGISDLPATIDYILEQTAQESLHYIGHSQGTTSFFVMASEKPEYNKKIRLMSALAPMTYSNNVKNPFIKLFLLFQGPVMSLLNFLGFNEILPHNALVTALGQSMCNDDAPTQDLCPLIFFLATGFDEPQLNKTMIPVIFSNFPAGGSLRQFWHYAQTMQSGKFRKFDYGLIKNLAVYGRITPPNYNLGKVTAPVAAYYSLNDWISSDVDVRRLIAALPNVAVDHLVGYNKFNHLDFMWATDGKTLLYDHVLEAMKSY